MSFQYVADLVVVVATDLVVVEAVADSDLGVDQGSVTPAAADLVAAVAADLVVAEVGAGSAVVADQVGEN